MNIKIEGMMEEYNSIVKKIRKIKNEHRYEEVQFETAESRMKRCFDSLKQLITKIDSEREEIKQTEEDIFIKFRQEYPNVSDEDIYSSMEYEDAMQEIHEDRNLCDKLEKQVKEYMTKYKDEIEKIEQDEKEFKEKQEKLKQEIKQKIINSRLEYGDELGVIQSIVKVNNKIVENIFEAGTRAEFELSKELRVPYNFYEDDSLCNITQKGIIFEGGNSFKKAEKCTLLREKDVIAKRTKKINTINKQIEENEEKYNEEGYIIVKGLTIPITQRELIEAGLIPETFKWKSFAKTDEEQTTQNNSNDNNTPLEEGIEEKGHSFYMIEYKEKPFSKFKNFLRRIFR